MMKKYSIYLQFVMIAGMCMLPALAIPLLCWTTPVCADAVTDNDMKAALVLKLPQYITFHEDVFENEKSEMVICVLGDKEFISSAKKLYKGRKINGRRVRLIDVQSGKMPESCHVVYVDSSAEKLSNNQIDHMLNLNVVTISNDGNFASRGGMVFLRLEDNKYAIEINLDVADRKQTVFNSQLLRIATIVYDEK